MSVTKRLNVKVFMYPLEVFLVCYQTFPKVQARSPSKLIIFKFWKK